MEKIKYKDFCDDAEKMVDFFQLSKEEFLRSYSYMTEEEYLLTFIKINNQRRSFKNEK
jgi:hypothetical protein